MRTSHGKPTKTHLSEVNLMNEYSKELFHHGVIGMHWGIRRYQPYGQGGYDPKKAGKFIGKIKKQIKKTGERISSKIKLNIADTKKERYRSDYRKARNKAKKYSKIAKRMEKEGFTNISKDYYKAAEAESLKRREALQKAKAQEKYIEGMVNSLLKKGYKIDRLETRRETELGKKFLAAGLTTAGGIIGAMAIPIVGQIAGAATGSTLGALLLANSPSSGISYKVR